MKRTSIRFRLITRLTSTLLVLAIATNAGLYVYLRGELIEQYDAALLTQARAVGAAWDIVGERPDAAALIARAFPHLRFGRPNGNYVRIVRGDGSAVMQVPAASRGVLRRDGGHKPHDGRVVYDLTLPNGKAGRAVEIAIDASGPNAATAAEGPSLVVVLAEDRREMDQTLFTFAVWLLSIGGGLSLVAIWLVLAIVHRELLPLGQFSEAVGRLSADSLNYRFPAHGLAEELLPVSARLNELLERLETAFGRERRFTGNVAHELRTPLAELRSMVEVAMKWPPEPEPLRRHHQNVLGVVQRMSTVTQTLLTLVRSERSQLTAVLEPVDLLPILKAAAAPHERAARQRQVSMDFVTPESLIVLADTAILSSLFDNLFANAALYAAPDSRITCAVAVDSDRRKAEVTLANAVTDLTADDLSRLDEPFWRKDPARGPSDHAGLGLTLVRAYAAALQVDVRFEMTEPNCLVACVTIPVPTADAG